jgi:hypothetical protein
MADHPSTGDDRSELLRLALRFLPDPDLVEFPVTVRIRDAAGTTVELTFRHREFRPTAAATAASPEELRPLTECKRDLMDILRGSDHRLTTADLTDELQRRNLHHGDSTVKSALAFLVKEGRLDASHKRPYGYRYVHD